MNRVSSFYRWLVKSVLRTRVLAVFVPVGYVAAVTVTLATEETQAGNVLFLFAGILAIVVTRRLERMLAAETSSRESVIFWRSFAQMMYVILGAMILAHLLFVPILVGVIEPVAIGSLWLIMPELIGFSLAFVFLVDAAKRRAKT